MQTKVPSPIVWSYCNLNLVICLMKIKSICVELLDKSLGKKLLSYDFSLLFFICLALNFDTCALKSLEKCGYLNDFMYNKKIKSHN